MIKVNIINEKSPKDYKKLFKKILRTTSKVENVKEKRVLNVFITDNNTIHDYNKKYRNVDNPTDVLSFPSDEIGELGDIIISYERAIAQANEYGHSIDREMGFLLIHGTLHCLGYDHIKKEDEEVMFPLQEKILNLVDLGRNL